MRLSVNTLVLALISSSVVMTDVLAVPLRNKAAPSTTTKNKLPSLRNKGPRSLAARQDAQGLNLTLLASQVEFLEDAVAGMSAVLVAVSGVVDALSDELYLNGDNTGDDGQDGGDGSGDDSNGDSGAGASGDSGSGDGTASGGADSDGANGGSGDDGTTDNGNSTITKRQSLPPPNSNPEFVGCILSGGIDCWP